MSKRKYGGTVTANWWVTRGDDEIAVEISGYYEPAQDGGWDEPSWSASVKLESCTDVNGQEVELTKNEIADAELRLLEKAEDAE